MAELRLFNNASNNTLVQGQFSTTPLTPTSLPFFYGDTPTLVIYPLEIPIGYNANDPQNSRLQSVSLIGLSWFVYITDGLVGGTVYTNQLTWTADPTNTFVTGMLSLNTPNIQSAINGKSVLACSLQMGYTQAGVPTTTFNRPITIGMGIPLTAPSVPAGLTALSVEVARTMFFPIVPVNGQVLYLASKNGKIIGTVPVDNPDGTATLSSTAIN